MNKLHINIIASGDGYQETAAWAAPTYVRQVGTIATVSVFVPEGEAHSDLLRAHSEKFAFRICTFPFVPTAKVKFTTQLKCQGFSFAISQIRNEDLVLFVDADTCCLRSFNLPSKWESAVLRGDIGLVPNRLNFHEQNPKVPWYLLPEEQLAYLNSGVILASMNTADIFKQFLELSSMPEFSLGRFNDQLVINYIIGKFCRHRLLLMDKAYNTEAKLIQADTIIGHFLGGAGDLGKRNRKEKHKAKCLNILTQQGLGL